MTLADCCSDFGFTRPGRNRAKRLQAAQNLKESTEWYRQPPSFEDPQACLEVERMCNRFIEEPSDEAWRTLKVEVEKMRVKLDTEMWDEMSEVIKDI